MIGALGLTTADEDNDATTHEDDATQAPQPTEWLNERTPEWDEAEAKLRSSEWTVADVKAKWKVNKRQEEQLSAMYGKPKQEAPKEPAKVQTPKAKVRILNDDFRVVLGHLESVDGNYKQAQALVKDLPLGIQILNSVEKLSTKKVALKTVQEVYDLDDKVLEYFEKISK